MVPKLNKESIPGDLSWLGQVREVQQPLTRLKPIWLRDSFLGDGPPLPRPTLPYPERHPYCEFTVGLQGRGVTYIGREKISTTGRSVLILGPGVPHTADLHEYPGRNIAVYFLPLVLLEMGPREDGARVLNRFTAEQSIRDRIVPLPPALWRKVKRGVLEMMTEFQRGGFGSELRLRSLLMDVLVALMRWEEAIGRKVSSATGSLRWQVVERALNYLQEHFAEAVYVKEVARISGVSQSQLNGIFREALGMSCVQYLNSYRISLAAAKLNVAKESVTEIALAVGFETLSHFNTTFRELIGKSPTEYAHEQSSPKR